MALGTTGISTTLVANTIGVGSNDVGTLCTSNKINAWSKWKPISYPSLNSITEEILRTTNYGLNIQSHNNYLDAYNEGIWYNLPTGGINSPYRLGDFRNYNHEAIAVFSKMLNIEANKLDTDIYRIEFMYNKGGSDFQIGLSDLIGSPIGAVYLAVILNDGTNSYIKTSDITINDGASYIDLPIKTGYLQSYEGTLNAKFVLCSMPFTTLSLLRDATGNVYYPLLVDIVSDAMCDIKISSSINLVMIATKISTSPKILYSDIETYITTPANPDAFYFSTSGGKLYLHITAVNNSSKAVTIGNHFSLKATPSITGTTSGVIACQLYDSAGNAADSITIPANSTGAFRIGSTNILFMNNGLASTPTEVKQIQSFIMPYYNGMMVNIAIDGPINISN